MSIVFITPPPAKPSEPGLSAAAAAQWLRDAGARAHWIDASIEWHHHVLSKEALSDALSAAHHGPDAQDLRVARAAADAVSALRTPPAYRDRHVYTSAASELEHALRLVARPFTGLRLGISMIAFESRRIESSRTLDWFAHRPGPFDDYIARTLIPRLDDLGASRVALSLTFQQQAPAAFRMAVLLRELRPQLSLWIGGPLAACWRAAGFPLRGAPFDSVDHIVAGDEADLLALADDRPFLATTRPLRPDLEEAPWNLYLAPEPVVPTATGRGCYWRRCSFCPDHQHPLHRPCELGALESWLHTVASRFPDGATIHFTDSAVHPVALERVADVVARDALPIRWHGFVRIEPCFASHEFVDKLARGGCAMLQLGVETGSPALLARTSKGTDPRLIRDVLWTNGAAGIRNQVYLLFGLPGETDDDRELTLELIESCADHVHAINPALLNLPRGSPMHRHPERHGITEIFGFGEDTDLSLYDDFRCGTSHPRSEARRWLNRRFFRSEAVRSIQGHLRTPFKANHLCFLPRPSHPGVALCTDRP